MQIKLNCSPHKNNQIPQLNKGSLLAISGGFDEASLDAVRQGAVNFVLVVKVLRFPSPCHYSAFPSHYSFHFGQDLLQVIGDEQALVKKGKSKSRESKTLSAPVGQNPSTFPAIMSPEIPGSWGSKNGPDVNEMRDLSMDDILEGYEDDSSDEEEEDEVSPTPPSPSKPVLLQSKPTPVSVTAPVPVPVPVPESASGFKPMGRGHQRQRSIKRPQPSSLHIGSPMKRGLPSPGNFEIPDIVLLENSSKRFTSCLRSLLASLKANDKEKYTSEADVCLLFALVDPFLKGP